MPVQEQLNIIFQLLQGGRSIPIENVIEIVPDVAGTGLATQGTSELAILGNGTATEVTSLVVDSTATEVSTAGVGLLALDVGVAGAAIAPALGILAGVGLYNLAPEFWTNVSNRLLEAGQTIGGKIRLFISGETKQVGVSEETLEIFKEAFIEAGLYNTEVEIPESQSSGIVEITRTISPTDLLNYGISTMKNSTINDPNNYIAQGLADLSSRLTGQNVGLVCYIGTDSTIELSGSYGNLKLEIYTFPSLPFSMDFNNKSLSIKPSKLYDFELGERRPSGENQVRTIIGYFINEISSPRISSSKFDYYYGDAWEASGSSLRPYHYISGANGLINRPNVQEGAIIPNENPIPEIYPSWTPFSIPVEGFPNVYPIEIPKIRPDPNQQQAQNPQEIPDNDPNALEWLIETLPQPDPNPNPYPEPAPNPDPDPAPEPEPIPEPEPEPTPENPVDPNPTPTPSPLPVVPDMPETVESNAMFTVYKPSMAQVNAFGGWLWSSSIIEAIKRIWQNPLDGIISFMKVYVNAPTSGSDTIKVGILDSEVSSPIVSGQFVTVECGSLNVREKFYNATDYSPFVAMHLYLPFIGIVELDIDEFMSGEIKVTYHVDVYTGTCLAEVKSRRSPDMPEWTIVYTFSGNASQQLPLTSAEFSGALSSLVGVVGGGLAIASGGGLGLLAGASGLAHAVSHEMVHLAHSGSLSANAGIMGARKPYLILTRRRGYDANGYNALYGYPSNKTVYLNNCSGYVKVKDIRLETSATEDERLEIENLLKSGVII